MTILTPAQAAQVREALMGSDHVIARLTMGSHPCLKSIGAALALLVETEVPQDIASLVDAMREDIVRYTGIGAFTNYVLTREEAAALIAARDEALVERCVEASYQALKGVDFYEFSRAEVFESLAKHLRAAKEPQQETTATMILARNKERCEETAGRFEEAMLPNIKAAIRAAKEAT